MRHLMAREGFEVGRDQVARLMRVGGVSGATRGRHPQRKTFCDPAAPRHPDLVNRNWAAQPARTSRESPTSATSGRWRGLVCVSFVTDVDSPQAGDPHWRILGWRVSARKETSLVSAALRKALFTRRWTESRFTTARLVPHRAAGSQAGLQWSLQHLELEVLAWEDRLGGRRGLPAGRQCGHRGVRGRRDARCRRRSGTRSRVVTQPRRRLLTRRPTRA